MVRVSDLPLRVDRVQLIHNETTIRNTIYSSFTVERVGRWLYVVGGITKGEWRNLRPVLGVLDIPEKRWRWIEYDGERIRSPNVFLYDDGLYVYRAHDWFGNWKSDVLRFDLSLEEFSSCNTVGNCPNHGHLSIGHYLEKLQRYVLFTHSRFPVEVYLLAMPECQWIKSVAKGAPPASTLSPNSCVHQGAIYLSDVDMREGKVHEMFVLQVASNDQSTWSSLRIGPYPFNLSVERLVSFHGKLLLTGGLNRPHVKHKITVYDPKAQELERVVLPRKSLFSYGHVGAVFTLLEGRTFGHFHARDDLYSFIRVAVDD